MKNRTILALAPILAVCSLMLGACADNPSAPPAAVNNQPIPSQGSSFTYKDISYDDQGKVIEQDERTIASSLYATNATVNGRSSVLAFSNSDTAATAVGRDSTFITSDAKGDVATILDIFNGNDVYNPGPVWVTLPIATKGTRKEVLNDVKNDDARWVYSATSQYIGSESMQVGTEKIATEHVKTTLTVTVSNGPDSQSSSVTFESWYAPSLHTFAKIKMASENFSTVRQLTGYRLR